jgi:hypothetical protein
MTLSVFTVEREDLLRVSLGIFTSQSDVPTFAFFEVGGE